MSKMIRISSVSQRLHASATYLFVMVTNRKQITPVQMLDAAERIDVDSALQHPLFKNLYSPGKVRVAERKIVLEFENIPNLGEMQLRCYFLLEIQKFHPEMLIPEAILQHRPTQCSYST